MNWLEKIVKNSSGETREALEQFVHETAELVKTNRRQEQAIEYLSHEVRLLRKKLYGTSSEKQAATIPEQLEAPLFNEFELCAQVIEPEIPVENTPSETAPKKKPGRKLLPKNLPRKVVEHDLSAAEKICVCGVEMECIGADVSEQLDYQPAKVTVLEHRCKKYGCVSCNAATKQDPLAKAQLKTAKKPLQLIPKSIATPRLLAQIAVQKFCDHLPLYRQENIFKRLDIDLTRQTMSTWMLKVGIALIPICNLMQEKILDYDMAYADETTLQVLNEPGRRAETKSYIWCFIGGPPDERIISYQYHASRSGDVASEFFTDYSGALHCDGYGGYAKLLANKNIIGINCMAHVRRKFVEALPSGKLKGVSGQVVRLIGQLYKIEESLKAQDASYDKITAVRNEKSKPILETLHKYLQEKASCVPPQSKVGKAISYTLKRWQYLTTYLLDGRYEIDNNLTERAIKPFVMGRKAWLFANSTAGADSSARLFSLIETAKANGCEVLDYLIYIFAKLPYCKSVADYEALLPWNFNKADFVFDI